MSLSNYDLRNLSSLQLRFGEDLGYNMWYRDYQAEKLQFYLDSCSPLNEPKPGKITPVDWGRRTIFNYNQWQLEQLEFQTKQEETKMTESKLEYTYAEPKSRPIKSIKLQRLKDYSHAHITVTRGCYSIEIADEYGVKVAPIDLNQLNSFIKALQDIRDYGVSS